MKRKITLPKGVEIAETRIVFTQSSDSCQNDDLPQQIEIFTDDAGGGIFAVISTERWAMDDSKQLSNLIQYVLNVHNNVR